MQDTAATLSVISALIALLAAVYARGQATAAMRANRIALHQDRLIVYKGVCRFTAHITASGRSLKEEEVWRFAEVLDLSTFYFTPVITRRLETVFKDALKFLNMRDEWTHSKECGNPEASSMVKPMHEQMRATRDEAAAIVEELRKQMHLGGL